LRKIYGPSFAQGRSDEAKLSDVLGELNELTSFKSIKTDVANAGAKWEDSEVVVDQGVRAFAALRSSRTTPGLPLPP
jgi:hypothetical protein